MPASKRFSNSASASSFILGLPTDSVFPCRFEAFFHGSPERRERIYSTEWIAQNTFPAKICELYQSAPWTLDGDGARTFIVTARRAFRSPRIARRPAHRAPFRSACANAAARACPRAKDRTFNHTPGPTILIANSALIARFFGHAGAAAETRPPLLRLSPAGESRYDRRNARAAAARPDRERGSVAS